MLGENCYFLGFMGAGKSYITKHLASYTHLPVMDLDNWIEEQEGHSIRHIFETKGERYFREIEQKALYQTSELAPCLIALGGGTPVYGDNMNWIKEHGRSIFLNPPLNILLQRLEKEAEQRPLLAKLSKAELSMRIQEKLEQRRLVYEQADFTITSTVKEHIIKDCLRFLEIK